MLSVSPPGPNSRPICRDLEGFRAEAGHYGQLFSGRGHGNRTENRGPILSAEKFIARSTLIGREIIGHSFSPSARSKRLSLIHDFSRIIADRVHPPLGPLVFHPVSSRTSGFSFLPFWILATSFSAGSTLSTYQAGRTWNLFYIPSMCSRFLEARTGRKRWHGRAYEDSGTIDWPDAIIPMSIIAIPSHRSAVSLYLQA